MNQFSRAVERLVDRNELTEYGPGTPRREFFDTIRGLDRAALFDPDVAQDDEMADCCQSAIWLANHFLDESHEISQRIHNASGSWLHGIMHRREGDFSNAKYWFRSVGNHPAFEQLSALCEDEIGQVSPDNTCWSAGTWDPFAYVDLCQAARTGNRSLRELCGQIARCEWLTIFDHCYTQALSAKS